MVMCSKCNSWYKISGSVRGECRCKASENWKKEVLYNDSCLASKPIVIPTFFENMVKVL